MSSPSPSSQTDAQRLAPAEHPRSSPAFARRVAVVLAVSIATLTVLHWVSTFLADRAPLDAIVRYDQPTFRLRFRAFNLDREMAIPAWFSSILMAANACLFFTLAWIRNQKRQGNALAWTSMAIVFLLLSIDESVAIHEVMSQRVRDWLGPYGTGLLYYAWFVPILAVMGVLIWFWVPAWLRLPPGTRWGLAGGVAVFLAGSVVIEAVMGRTMENYGLQDPPLQGASISIQLLIIAEEVTELIGVAIIAYVLVRHIVPQVAFTVIQTPDRKPPMR